MKLFAGRETDLRDARSIMVRQGAGRLDWLYIEQHLGELGELGELKEDPDLLPLLRRIQQSCEAD